MQKHLLFQARTCLVHCLFPLALFILATCPSPPARLHASEHRKTVIVQSIDRVIPSVVNIHGRKTVRSEYDVRTGDNFKPVNGMGTGIVVDERGYILTNYHVVEGVSRIQVSLANKQEYIARLVAHDPKTDLAVIKITTPKPLEVIKFGTSSDLMLGETVIAVGNAFGYPHTVTKGIVSALKRSVQVSDEQMYDDLIQTDASINPGNSGGPLINVDGEMIGVNVAVRVGAQGIGFAIPVDEALDVAARLISVEQNQRLAHGVSGRTIVDGNQLGFLVESVRSGSPAGKAGIKKGDLITSVGSTDVYRPLDFERALLSARAGENHELSILRDRSSLSLDLTLVQTVAKPISRDRMWSLLGMRLEPIPATTFRAYKTRYHGGLRVAEIRGGGPASRQGIRSGDVLVGMHIWETISIDNVNFILNSPEFQQIQPVKFYILRGSETLYGHMQVSVNE